MAAEDQVYRDLQKHLDKSPTGFPEMESGTDIQLLKNLLTPEEAKIAMQLSNIQLEPVKRIYKRAKKSGMSMSIEELQKKLDHMVFKGTILAYEEGYGEKRYKNVGVSAGGMIDFQVNRITQELLDDLDKYHEESFARQRVADVVRTPQLRTIPVDMSVPVPERYLVSNYDDVRLLVEKSPGPFSVANCVCRQMKDLRGKGCQYSDIRETCLQIGPDHARRYVEMGIGRYITKEEAYDVLDKAREAGFILQPENSQRPENICCCCGDCCGPLVAAVNSPRPVDLYATNYYAEVDSGLCKGCGTCVTRCQLKARSLVDGIATVDLDRCIGCGNCVVTCESKASQLHKKEQELVPPEYKDTLFMQMMSRKSGKWYMLKLRTRMLLGLRV